MSRSNKSVRMSVGLVLATFAAFASAQSYQDPGVMTSITNSNANDNKLVDINVMPSVSDPKEVDVLFKEGSEITSVLDGLNEKGFHIEYKKKHFLPTMTLTSIPQATKIDDLVREIVGPYDFSVYRSPMGKVIVTPAKQHPRKVEIKMEDKTQGQ
jgi:hypothetical protein